MMIFNFFRKRKTGWELPDLMNLLTNNPHQLLRYTHAYSLAAINHSKDKFVVIRKFEARKEANKIYMLNASGDNPSEPFPISQYGMTLVSVTDTGAYSHNVILPNSLKYESVEVFEETIIIRHSAGITTTNFSEIKKLWTTENLGENEILNRFDSLVNLVEVPQEIIRHKALSIKDDFFGKLNLNEKLDVYEVKKEGVDFQFSNTSLDDLRKNFRKAEKLIPLLPLIKDKMTQEMLPLKNDDWSEINEPPLSSDEFQKDVKIESVLVNEEGDAELCYNALDLFWGHLIVVSIDIDQKYLGASIFG